MIVRPWRFFTHKGHFLRCGKTILLEESRFDLSMTSAMQSKHVKQLLLRKVLALLVAFATGVLGVPLEKKYEFAQDTGREHGTPRLLREGWRLPDESSGSADPFGKATTAQYGEEGIVPKGDISVPPAVDQTVEQGAESRPRPQTIRVFGRSLLRPSPPTRRPQPPFYRGAEHLAEKPALPPHVLKARSEERVRSRSRPVHKPLYTSSDHLAERPAIPLPQLEAYESSRGSVGLTPYVEQVVQKGSQTENSTTAASKEVTVVPPRFSKPDTTTPAPAAQTVGAEEPAGLEVEPSLFGAEKDIVPEAETGEASDVFSQASSATPYPPEKPEGTHQDKLQPGAASSYAPTPEKGYVSVPLTTGTDSVQGASEQSVDAEGLKLYSFDNEISRDHVKHQSSVPTTTPYVTSSTSGQYEKPSSPSTPRRRFTFRPFSRTSALPAASPVIATTTTTTAAAPEEGSLYGGALQSDDVQAKAPGISAGPNVGQETTKNLLISTEPTIRENDSIPEVPQEPEVDEDGKRDEVATTVAVPVTSAAVPSAGDRNDSVNPFGATEADVEVTEKKEAQREQPVSSESPADAVQASRFSGEPVKSHQATTLQPTVTNAAFPTLPALHESSPSPDVAGTVAAVGSDASLSEIPGEEAAAAVDVVQPEKGEGPTAVLNEDSSLLLSLGFSSETVTGTMTVPDAGDTVETEATGSTVLSTETSSVPSVFERREEVATGPQDDQPTAPATVAEETLQPGQYARGIPSTYIGPRSVDF